MDGKFLVCLFCVGVLSSVSMSHASEEEYLNWQSAEIRFMPTSETGTVFCEIISKQGKLKEFLINAFGKEYELTPAQIGKVSQYPLNSFAATQEAGYPSLGGHTVHFKFERYLTDGSGKTKKLYVSVSKGKGLTLSEY